MKKIETPEDWAKVAKYARDEYTKEGMGITKWLLPRWLLNTVGLFCILAIIFDADRSVLCVAVLGFIAVIQNSQSAQIEGYIDGWFNAQYYIEGDDTIDSLASAKEELKELLKKQQVKK